ncbi:MAG: hypothetical protein ACU83N_00025 [Gammaproteobacteria bacterium]
MNILFGASLISLIGGLILTLTVLVVATVAGAWKTTCPMKKPEIWSWVLGIALTICGSIVLFVVPAYEGGGIVTRTAIDSDGKITTEVLSSGSGSETFLEVNGPAVIPLFSIPILIPILPIIGRRSMFRPLLHGVSAFLLGGQAAIGISGYGLAFAPSSLAILIAGIAALIARKESVA